MQRSTKERRESLLELFKNGVAYALEEKDMPNLSFLQHALMAFVGKLPRPHARVLYVFPTPDWNITLLVCISHQPQEGPE